MQGHLLVFRPNQVVDDVRAGRVATTIAEPPLAHVTEDDRGGVVNATVLARVWRQVLVLKGNLLLFLIFVLLLLEAKIV